MSHQDLPELMEENFLEYASYVISERAIPNIVDGLKPVQRRILYTLFKADDGKLHKVANITGQTMAYHPHGDAPIYDALVNLSNKGFLLDQQGNFGNIFTGDPASAARYIETRLSQLAKETVFNDTITQKVPSYDNRKQEPVTLPAKIPLLLMQGAEGIAVGMSTRILPHNFVELLEAEIAILEGKSFSILPDFLTGGIMDASEYNKGRGKVKLRAKIETIDTKTVRISDICYSTTTESLIRSIDDAAKKGKIKIESISDLTAEKVNIEIKLPRGQYATDLIPALYAYTDCQVSLNSQMIVIQDNLPVETDVDSALHFHVEKLKSYLKQELELLREQLKEKIFLKTLEQIFIENRLYKKLEKLGDYEKIHTTLAKSLEPYLDDLLRTPTHEDREHLLSLPIRRITRFDIEKNEKEIDSYEKQLKETLRNLKNLVKYSISYLKNVLKKYGKLFPRRTEISTLEQIDKRDIARKEVKVGFDKTTGMIGTKVTGDLSLTCTNFDKILIFFKNGTYRVINIPEKEFLQEKSNPPVYIGVADKKTEVCVIYRDPQTDFCYGKRFVISKFILAKEYRYFEEHMKLEALTTEQVEEYAVEFRPKPKQKVNRIAVPVEQVQVKGVSAKGIRLGNKAVKKAKFKTKKNEES